MKTIWIILGVVAGLALVGLNIYQYYELKKATEERVVVEQQARAVVDSMQVQFTTALTMLDSIQRGRDTIVYHHRTKVERVIERYNQAAPQPNADSLSKSLRNILNNE